jgi:hypothetical protein
MMDRKQLNHRIRKLAHGVLGLDVETYRTIVSSIAENSEGHLTRCTDDEAYLVLLALDRMVAGGKDATSVIVKNPRQQKFIARLMDYLGWAWKDTARFCFHQTGKASTRQCSAGELSKVIIGMIRIIDDRIEKKLILLTPAELSDYQRYTKLHRTTNSSAEATCQVGSMS